MTTFLFTRLMVINLRRSHRLRQSSAPIVHSTISNPHCCDHTRRWFRVSPWPEVWPSSPTVVTVLLCIFKSILSSSRYEPAQRHRNMKTLTYIQKGMTYQTGLFAEGNTWAAHEQRKQMTKTEPKVTINNSWLHNPKTSQKHKHTTHAHTRKSTYILTEGLVAKLEAFQAELVKRILK